MKKLVRSSLHRDNVKEQKVDKVVAKGNNSNSNEKEVTAAFKK